MPWKKVTLGDPLRYGSPMIWVPCQRYLLWHQEKIALNDTHGDHICFRLKPRKGAVWGSVCLRYKGGGFVERASVSGNGGHPKIQKVIFIVGRRSQDRGFLSM